MSTMYSAYVGDEEFTIIVYPDGSVEVDGEYLDVDLQHISDNVIFSMLIKGRSNEVYATQEKGAWRILLDGERYEVVVEDEQTKRLKSFVGPDHQHIGEIQVAAPMPGMVVSV
ncbi:MAG: hypothetical protein ACRDIB_20025, partial [Ardenticatenaceae bacterium]